MLSNNNEAAPRTTRDRNNINTASLLDAALDYAKQGWPVLPCRESEPRAKRPYILGGFHNASVDADQIQRWWYEWPGALIGLAIPPGVVVLDFDKPGALAVVEAINEGPLPDTLTARTGRAEGGTHYYYRHHIPDLSQTGVRRVDGTLVRGVDVRVGGKGYLIAPPSPHPVTGTRYQWTHVRPLAELPERLARACRPVAPRPGPRPAGVFPVDPHARHKGLLDVMRQAREGERNRTLFWCACRMVDDEADGTPASWDALTDAALATGLPASEIAATITSAAVGTLRHD